MHPFDEQLKALIRHHQIRTRPVVEARVVGQNADGTLELETAPELGLGEGLSGVPLALAPGIASVKLAAGARALLEFIDDGPNNPERPIVRAFLEVEYLEVRLAATAKVAMVAPAVDVGDNGATVRLAGGNKPVIRAGDVPAEKIPTLLSAAAGAPVTGAYATTPLTQATVLA